MPSPIRFPGTIVMPRIRRRFLLAPAEVGVYHCINRCVRCSFLFGTDPISGKHYDHRRPWIQDRSSSFAIPREDMRHTNRAGPSPGRHEIADNPPAAFHGR